MKTKSAIKHIQKNKKVNGKSLASHVYQIVRNDTVIKELYNQRMFILDNHQTPPVTYHNGTKTASLFSKEDTELLEEIGKMLQERYETLLREIHHRLTA
jgi:hypothetical protein